MTGLEGAAVLVTGASRGLGEALVRGYAAAGARVAFCARGDTRALAENICAQGGEALSVRTDVGDPAAVRALIDAVVSRFGTVDVLVNNVGIAGPTAPLGEIGLDAWDQVLRVNVTSCFLLAQAVVPYMRKAGRGVIVTIGSVTGKRPLRYRLPYATSKTALIGFTRTLAEELGPEGIRVNLISPDAIVGERVNEIFRAQAEATGRSETDVRAEFERKAPLGAMVEYDDVCELAMFLSSSAAAKITGQDINLSAGSVMY